MIFLSVEVSTVFTSADKTFPWTITVSKFSAYSDFSGLNFLNRLQKPDCSHVLKMFLSTPKLTEIAKKATRKKHNVFILKENTELKHF